MTVVLLTFTILTFASFSNTWGIRTTYVGPREGPARVMLRQALWSPVEASVEEMYEGRMKGRAIVVPRYWVSPTAQEADDNYDSKRPTSDLAVCAADGGNLATLAALVGLEAEDLKRLDSLTAIFAAPAAAAPASAPGGAAATQPASAGAAVAAKLADDGIYLTEAMAERVGLKPGDELLVAGLKLKLAGVVSPRSLTDYTQLEGSSLLPVDYQASQSGGAKAFSNEVLDEDGQRGAGHREHAVRHIQSGPGGLRLRRHGPAAGRAAAELPGLSQQRVGAPGPGLEAAKLAPLPAYVGARRGSTGCTLPR